MPRHFLPFFIKTDWDGICYNKTKIQFQLFRTSLFTSLQWKLRFLSSLLYCPSLRPFPSPAVPNHLKIYKFYIFAFLQSLINKVIGTFFKRNTFCMLGNQKFFILRGFFRYTFKIKKIRFIFRQHKSV